MTQRAKALFEHCKTVYGAMEEAAETRAIGGEEVLVWEGYTTKLFAQLGFNAPDYSSIRFELMRMDCIRQLRRGGGPTTSQWLLLQAPDRVTFEAMAPTTRALQGREVQRRFEQLIKNLGERIDVLERNVRNLEAMKMQVDGLEQRIKNLETKTTVLNTYGGS